MEKPTAEDVKNIVNELVLPFYETKRDMQLPLTERRPENDAEHSWSLGLVSCMLADRIDPMLDKGKIAQLALIHDLVEIFAGDTSVWDADNLDTKTEREAAALERLKMEYANYSWLIETIQEYEDRHTAEAKFVNAVDKLMAITIRLVDNEAGYHFYIDGVPLTLEEYKKRLAPTRDKAHSDPRIGKMYEEIYAIFLSHPDWFRPAAPKS